MPRSSLGIHAVLSFTLFILATLQVRAQKTPAPSVTLYWVPGQTPFLKPGASTDGASVPMPTSLDAKLQAYSTETLVAPPPPGTAMPTAFPLAVPSAVPQSASFKQNGSFFGFSLEMSVVNQVLGKNSSLIQVPFLNLMSNLVQRVGRVNVRVGGNTQETATLVESTPDGKILEKDLEGATNPTQTPPLIFTADLIQLMRSISGLVNVHWYLGVPFNDTSNWRLDIIEKGQEILGDYLIGVQAGNEPDLYGPHGHRPKTYNQDDFFNEFGSLIKAIDADPKVNGNNLLIGPSTSVNWTPESVLFAGTGFIPTYGKNLYAISVEHYPFDNCGRAFPGSGIPIRDPQELMPVYLSHKAAQDLVKPYLNATQIAAAAQKPFIMFETNSASCGGFPGLSDAFGAALWGLDYGMKMASVNFTSALFHIGGQSVSYNPFTPPPTNESVFHQWSVGPIYYSALVMAEALGPTNTAQIADLNANAGSDFSPAYGIWENGALARVLLLNYVDDPSGASDISVDITMPGGTLPASVDVKYLLAANVTQKGNYTWAGQTFGGYFDSDGRLDGIESVAKTSCGVPSNGQTPVCRVKVPAPGAALVFMTGSAAAQETAGAATATFSTSVYTNLYGAATVLPWVIATSNGRGGSSRGVGSTSKGKKEDSETSGTLVSAQALGIWLVVGGALLSGWITARGAF